ncbi:Homeobox protein knotted-1-like 6 [Morus notabilis]|uniref:Homeobox protein knotted-1-like 6 n=1 Tax=Morus notabilis TaxID=981085 RepID=W9SCP7_9ROSA|nr:homeobox protein knotted-1-like 6 [Morus notabilis]EXC21662.1 Homeobox protein knotted-1-like 6 [Morus notabilis]
MENDLYGIGSAPATVSAEYMGFEVFDDDRVQMAFGSDPIFPASSSAVSDAASMAAAEAQRGSGGGGFADEFSGGVREKIASHPLYPKLLEAYIECRKVGAPPEIASELEEIRQESDQLISRRTAVSTRDFGSDPELDDFMETYCGILVKYKSDLSRPFDEATTFLNEMQSQLNSLCNNPTTTASTSYVSGL